MSRDNNNNLPSYKDFLEKPSDDLPSLEEVLEENLPSVNDFLPSQVEEETQTIENSDGDSFLEVTDVVKAPEWSELVRLVNDVRKDIPQIPEIKSYDDELEGICSQIEQIQTNFSLLDAKSDKITDLSAQNEEFEVKLTEIESKIPEVPEVRYYEEDIRFIHDKITRIRDDINNLPEVKYYENDLDVLKSRIEEVNEAIPTFPDWVQEVQEVPDFSWIGKTFSLIDDDFNKVQGHLDIIREKIDYQVNELNDSVEKKEFDLKVDIKNLNSSLNDTNIYLGETKDKIYKEIKDSSIRIWEHHKEFKDDDRKLKKAILSEQNKLKQSLQKEIKEINEKSVKADESILKFFTDLRETVDALPEVKYYDKDISKLRKDLDSTKDDIKGLVSDLSEIATTIKEQQEIISEGYLLNEPPEQKQTAGGQTDPLTPEDQKFATLKDLSAHYRLFINRVQTQLSTMGGGGAGFIKDLDDVEFDQTEGNNKLLIYDQANSKWVGIASTALGGGTGVASTDFISGIAITMTTGNFTNVNVSGTITYDDVTRLDSLGFSTFRSGLEVNTGTATTALLVNGDARITGILTIGQGSITLDPNAKQVTGIDEIVVGSGASISLAPLFTMGGTFVVDYSQLTLKGYNSAVNGTYNRQSNSFVLGTAPSASGSARFQQISGYYYFLHESNNGKIIIFNVVDGTWSAIFSSGSNFSSPSDGTLVNPITVANFITPVRETYDDTGRAYPGSGFGIEYKTTVSDHNSSLGIATASSLEVSGIATVSTAFYMPQYTTAARSAATFNEGAMIYNTTSKKMEFYDGTSWIELPGMTLGLAIALDG